MVLVAAASTQNVNSLQTSLSLQRENHESRQIAGFFVFGQKSFASFSAGAGSLLWITKENERRMQN